MYSPKPKLQYKLLIGIDPGVHTGLAIYDRTKKKLLEVITTGIIQAQITVRHNRFMEQINLANILVRMEDARLRTWFGDAGREVLMGAGSIKRDCSMWEEFLKYHSIPYEFVAPKNNKTKTDAKLFNQITGWSQKTNEHGRDAAMLVFGY
jgi:hypothetical protein